MKHLQYKKLYYHISHRYFTLNNAVIAIAFLIAASWTWGAIQVMQRNYTLQQVISDKQQKLALTNLEAQTLKFENRYYRTDEYKELAVRESLGYGLPGEKVIVLPPNSAPDAVDTSKQQQGAGSQPLSNFELWLRFLFGNKTS